jgi:hypothetical protein
MLRNKMGLSNLNPWKDVLFCGREVRTAPHPCTRGFIRPAPDQTASASYITHPLPLDIFNAILCNAIFLIIPFHLILDLLSPFTYFD